MRVIYFFVYMVLALSPMAHGASVSGGGSSAAGATTVFQTDRTYGEAVSQSSGARFGDDSASEYYILYRDPSNGLTFTCEKSGVLHDCDKGIEVKAGKSFNITTDGTVKFTYDATTGRVTKILRYQKICGGDLVGISPADGSASHIWNKSPLDTAPTPTAITGTNRNMGVATFPDSDGDYGVQLACTLPTDFDGTLDAVIWWKTTGTGNARFQVKTKCYADDETGDASFNAAFAVTAAAGTSGRPNRQAMSGITATGCDANELIRFDFLRNRTEGSDTLNAALDVEKVEFWAWGQ